MARRIPRSFFSGRAARSQRAVYSNLPNFPSEPLRTTFDSQEDQEIYHARQMFSGLVNDILDDIVRSERRRTDLFTPSRSASTQSGVTPFAQIWSTMVEARMLTDDLDVTVAYLRTIPPDGQINPEIMALCYRLRDVQLNLRNTVYSIRNPRTPLIYELAPAVNLIQPEVMVPNANANQPEEVAPVDANANQPEQLTSDANYNQLASDVNANQPEEVQSDANTNQPEELGPDVNANPQD